MQKTNVGAQIIDRLSLEICGMIIATFQVLDKLNYFSFSQKTIILAKISMKVILDMRFLTFSNADI